MLGDNIFFGSDLDLAEAARPRQGATTFACRVSDPERLGVEEIACEMGWIDAACLARHAAAHGKSAYGAYLQRLLQLS